MGFLIDEQRVVDENIFQYEGRLKSPSARIQSTTPTFVTYYHINVDESTVDTGFKDVASILGHRSPIRFNKIENFPITGLDQVVLNIQDEEQGLDSNFDGDAIIYSGTIRPVPNDFFIIPVFDQPLLFKVTDINYDTAISDNFYRITFKLEFSDQVMIDQLNKQVMDDYICNLTDIGTEQQCILKKSIYEQIKIVDKVYKEIVDFYMAMFYSKRHNVFLVNTGMNKKLYDPLQTEFINKHQLFNQKNDLKTIMLTDEYASDSKRKLKYQKSFYRYVELRRNELLSRFPYTIRPGVTIKESTFSRWYETNIDVLDITEYNKSCKTWFILTEEYKTCIEIDAPCESEVAEFIKKFLRKEDLKITDIPDNVDEELIYMNNDIEVFFFTPVVLYIIREIIKKETSKEKGENGLF